MPRSTRTAADDTELSGTRCSSWRGGNGSGGAEGGGLGCNSKGWAVREVTEVVGNPAGPSSAVAPTVPAAAASCPAGSDPDAAPPPPASSWRGRGSKPSARRP